MPGAGASFGSGFFTASRTAIHPPAVPGYAGNWISIRDAVKKPLPKDAPLPGKFRVREKAAAAPAEAQKGA